MRNILFLFLLVFMSSCRSTQEVTNAHDDVYDVADRSSSSDVYYDEDESNYRSYNDIVYNDPWRYNSYRFGFGVGIGSPLYYGPYWGNSWYWGNPYGYYNPWNSGMYYNPWGYYNYWGNPYYGYGWPHYHGYYDTNFGISHIISPRPSMSGRSRILNNPLPASNIGLIRPENSTRNRIRTEIIRPENRIRNNPPVDRGIRQNPPMRTSPRVSPPPRSIPSRVSPSPRSPSPRSRR